MRDHLQRCISVRYAPLSYVFHEDDAVPATVPALALNQPYLTEHGSIEDELVARADHNDGLFRDDNATVYFKLEEALRGSQYAPSIKPFQKRRDGRNAFISLGNQFAGTDKWELELKKQDSILHNRKWRAQGNYTLEKFCQYHCNAYVMIISCSQHVSYQLPNEHTRARYLLDAIECNDPPLLAAIANR